VEEEEIAEVEMLLEAYFMHVDNTFNRLQTLNEYIQVGGADWLSVLTRLAIRCNVSW
jgi:hypothetical protein